MEPRFFDPTEFRQWLEENHASATEVLVGFHKGLAGKVRMTWPQSVDQALCFGWIDGIRKSLDDTAYTIRFTPRKRDSTWSAINIRRMGELSAAGLVHPAGLAAFEARTGDRSRVYSYENKPTALPPEYEARFRADAGAWAYFASRSPSYRRTAMFWVMDAKREETRQRRLAALIEDSAAGRDIAPLRRGRSP